MINTMHYLSQHLSHPSIMNQANSEMLTKSAPFKLKSLSNYRTGVFILEKCCLLFSASKKQYYYSKLRKSR